MNLVSLQFITTDNFEANLKHLVKLIKGVEKGSFILAPELCLNGYAYENMDSAVEISSKALPILKELSVDRTIALTLTTKTPKKYKNTLYIFHGGKIVHTQSKHQLFVMNDERKYFKSGELEDIKIVKVGELKVAALICFELRYTELWDRIKGADIILVPALWGKNRKDHFEALTKALAIANQCFVIASDSANEEAAKSSGIITPFGIEFRDDSKELIEQKVDMSEIKKMRRYLNVGIK